MSRWWQKTYGSSSLTAKALAFIPYYLTYRKTYKFLKKSQYWSKQQIEDYQTELLKKLIAHAYENVPYYQRIFDERNLKPSDIQKITDLSKLPFLTKEIVRENLEDLQARNYSDESFEYVTTGGSTGTPLGFYYHKGFSRAKEWAFMKTQWDRVGYKYLDKCIILRGNIIKNSDRGKLWEKTFFGRWLVLSSYHMNDGNLPKYVEIIRSFRPKYIQAYPSVITILAIYLKNHNIDKFPTIKAILCGSENLYQWQRDLLEDTFKCRVYSWYGNSEQTVLAGECECSNRYHFFPEYGIVEVIPEDRVNDIENISGEIVTTRLDNFIFPFIRYKTGDIGKISNDNCCCKRNYQLISQIDGRKQDIIFDKNNTPITLTALIFAQHFMAFSRCKELQLFQNEVGKIIIRIVKDEYYSEDDEQEIITKLKNVTNDNLEIIFQYVDSVKRTKSGKLMFLEQKIPLKREVGI